MTSFTKDRMRELVSYVMEVPTDEKNSTSYRYPFVAQEILKSGSPVVTGYFFPKSQSTQDKDADSELTTEESGMPSPAVYGYSKSALDHYIKSFLRKEESTDPVLSGYFSSIVTALQQQKPAEMTRYLNEDPEIEELLLDRISAGGVANVLKQIMTKERFGKILRQYFLKSDSDSRLNIKTLILHYIKSVHNTRSDVESPLEFCFDENIWLRLREDMIPNKGQKINTEERLGKKTSAEILSEFISLLDKNKKFSSGEVVISLYGSPEDRSNILLAATIRQMREKYLTQGTDSWVIDFLTEHLEGLNTFFKEIALRRVANSAGVDTLMMDTHLLAIVDQVRLISTFDFPAIDSAFCKSGILDTLLDLFLKIKWNTFFQQSIAKILKHMLSCDAESELFKYLTEGGFITKFLLKAHEAASKENTSLIGYIGIVNEICTMINSTLEESKKKLIQENEAWEDLHSRFLSQIFTIERSDREDVFRRAFKKDSFDAFEDLKSGGFGGFSTSQFISANKFTTHSSDDKEEEEEDEQEIADALNERHADDHLNKNSDDEEEEGDDKAAKKEIEEETGNPKSDSPVLVFRLSNDLDTDKDDGVLLESSENKGKENEDSHGKQGESIEDLLDSLKAGSDELTEIEADKNGKKDRKHSPYDIAFGDSNNDEDDEPKQSKSEEKGQLSEEELNQIKKELNDL